MQNGPSSGALAAIDPERTAGCSWAGHVDLALPRAFLRILAGAAIINDMSRPGYTPRFTKEPN